MALRGVDSVVGGVLGSSPLDLSRRVGSQHRVGGSLLWCARAVRLVGQQGLEGAAWE